MTRPERRQRDAAAAVEFAVLLPFLIFTFVIALDWARLFYYSVAVTSCARNGALWQSDSFIQAASPYTTVTQAALADATDLSPSPSVSTSSGSDSNGSYVEVTVSYSFQTVTNFPGVPSTTTLARTVRMYVAPTTPS